MSIVVKAWDIIGIVLASTGMGVAFYTFADSWPHVLLLPAMLVFGVGFIMLSMGDVEDT